MIAITTLDSTVLAIKCLIFKKKIDSTLGFELIGGPNSCFLKKANAFPSVKINEDNVFFCL